MKLDISFENINNFAFTNYNRIKNAKKIMVFFHGLETIFRIKEIVLLGAKYAKSNILFVYPYTPTANWMNQFTVNFVDDVLAALFEHDKRLAEIPIISYGESMGGHGALLYVLKSKYKIEKCVAICPVCDLKQHINEQSGLISKLYFAYSDEPGGFEDVLKSKSPTFLVDDLPDIEYLFIHCENDLVVPPEHSKKMVELMKKRGLNVKFEFVINAAHCRMDESAVNTLKQFIEK